MRIQILRYTRYLVICLFLPLYAMGVALVDESYFMVDDRSSTEEVPVIVGVSLVFSMFFRGLPRPWDC